MKNDYIGIYMYHCLRYDIVYNNLSYNEIGCSFVSSNFGKIIGNIISNNNKDGVIFGDSHNNSIDSNIVSNNNETGIVFFESSYNTISNCEIIFNGLLGICGSFISNIPILNIV